MGEVYRADDLKLGQPVALKFLPSGLEQDPLRLGKLLEEVKLARQVSHPNVCRVYDAGDVDGQHFLSMEYVDGEDLASLLRRIGHVPGDRAVAIARQICAGLAAAHTEGILHRDLKPANVMIDGRGRAKISDFGLASLAGTEKGDEVVRGTPGYMAPEQLDGKQATVRSDIYSLGLVLYELFTGKRAFNASTPAEMVRLQRESTPISPTSHAAGFDPAVENVILRCLDRDPAARPGSVLAVAAALPGGDPLAAALAAGETPPPEMVAAAGGEGALKPAAAGAALAMALVGLILIAFSSEKQIALGHGGLEYPPDVMIAKAREIVEAIGYDESPMDEGYSFLEHRSYIDHVARSDKSLTRWENLDRRRPTTLGFWYRRSPRPMQAVGIMRTGWSDPPMRLSGMVRLRLDAMGRLEYLEAVPPQRDETPTRAYEPDWDVLFAAAGLDPMQFASTDPQWIPKAFCDAQAAWTGRYPGQEEPQIRVEACAYRNRPVYFDIVYPWTKSDRIVASNAGGDVNQLIFFALFLGVGVSAAFIARRNLKTGRGDRKGAFRVSAFFVLASMIPWFLGFDTVLELGPELRNFFMTFGLFLMVGMTLWLMYIAAEPFARRVWPELLISWTRLLTGRFRNPLAGKEFLLGALLGMSASVLRAGRLEDWMLARLDQAPAALQSMNPAALNGIRSFAAAMLDLAGTTMMDSMLILFVLVLSRFLLRRRWLAAVPFVLIGLIVDIPHIEHLEIGIPFSIALSLLTAFAFIRFGLVGGFAAGLFVSLPEAMPMTTDLSAWYFNQTLAALLLMAALLAYAFLASINIRTPARAET